MSNEIIPVKEIYSNGAWPKNISIMKGLICNGSGKILYTDVSKAKNEKPTDAAVKIVKTTICGTELDILQGKTPSVKPGTILCYEGVGIIEEVGTSVGHFKKDNFTQLPLELVYRFGEQEQFYIAERYNSIKSTLIRNEKIIYELQKINDVNFGKVENNNRK
jgi:hypothetical protein